MRASKKRNMRLGICKVSSERRTGLGGHGDPEPLKMIMRKDPHQ